jgi:hypothetical protein
MLEAHVRSAVTCALVASTEYSILHSICYVLLNSYLHSGGMPRTTTDLATYSIIYPGAVLVIFELERIALANGWQFVPG